MKFSGMVQSVEPTKVWIISVQDNLVGSWIMDSNFVVRKAVGVMKIEDKNDICAFKNNDFVIFMFPGCVGWISS